MIKLYFIFAAFFGMTAVILGAFGAHALKSKLTETLLHSYETAVQYQFLHALALLATTILSRQLSAPHTQAIAQELTQIKYLNGASMFFIVGVVLFSGSLYLLSLTSIRNVAGFNIGIITPIGGLCLIVGWALLLYAAFQQ